MRQFTRRIILIAAAIALLAMPTVAQIGVAHLESTPTVIASADGDTWCPGC